jgi:hypothetical protein
MADARDERAADRESRANYRATQQRARDIYREQEAASRDASAQHLDDYRASARANRPAYAADTYEDENRRLDEMQNEFY